MPPRPKSPAMRYRPATTVPGRKRPSSTLMVVLRWGTLEAPVPRTTVSAELASSGAAQDEQKRLFWAHSREQAGHRTMRSILARRGHLGFEAPVGAPGGIPLRQRQVDILDRLVDFRRVLETYGHAIDARITEGEPHRRLPVLAVREPTLSHQLHADHANAFGADLLDMRDHFVDLSRPAGGEVLRVHDGALVVHPDHGDIQPLVSGEPAQRRQPVDRRAVSQHHLLRLGFQNPALRRKRSDG